MKSVLLRALCALCLLAAVPLTYAQVNESFDDVFSDTPTFLKVDQAFVFDYAQQGDNLAITFDIAEGYYLYKKQFKFATKNAELGEATYPEARIIEDEFFGESEVFFDGVKINTPIVSSLQDGVVKIRYQGCAEAGLCYPPTTKVIYLSSISAEQESQVESTASSQPPVSQQNELLDRLVNNENLALTLLVFFALGVGLAFTPCVFPMYPIVSGIVIGHGKSVRLGHAFKLTFVYVQGMAITYSLLGLVVASAGVQFQVALQHPIILGIFITIFGALALAMFGAYEIQLPSSWQERLTQLSNNQKQGSLVGVFVMGILSGLIASPCTTAPLTGILLFIAQTGDMLVGFLSLYLLSLGMGLPLIIFGMTGGKLLPKAGEWMNVVKVIFGFMMLAVALIFVERLWVSEYTDLLWSLLGLAAFVYLLKKNAATQSSAAKFVRTIFVVAGLVGSAYYGYSTMSTITTAHTTNDAGHPQFMVVKSAEDLAQKVAAANAQGKSVMVDLYADWCVACKEFEKYTFTDPKVIDALGNTVWMQIDLTDNTPVNIEFQQQLDVLGLPTILFFDTQGNELSHARVTGFMKGEDFAAHVNNILQN
ncbi:protein-disulfide reductase DsbD [Alteromonas sp. KUL49]|uniref:protein-disulfide reductase DsbD n=1 Tax=Alteromonas sp. KUL49 TaxID=2480798 RepID=UPI00102EE0E4|nr:protein-disulfide reductase DsbD [Alteromonas sp. KUL49]TAP42242.1 protein-disulfide reductase DsbD [Alteromonas sp. KUL49]GEA09832.1 thiol:disulfide interchange protein DsbD [Alteromonas sp. KUL49]